MTYSFLRCSALILFGLLIYGQTFHFDFVFDDYMFIVNDSFIKDFSRVPLIWHSFPMTRSIGLYSFALNYHFNQLHPQGYHIFNFVIHLLAAVLVWALADMLLKITKWCPLQDRLTREVPFIIAVLFLVHPCQTQAVSYISQRFESMATVFYLGTIYCYLRARISNGMKHKIILLGLAGLLTILGILTKEVTITIPLMLLASEWILWPKEDNRKFYIVLSVGGVLLFLLFSKFVQANLSVFLQSTPSQSHDGDVLTPLKYFLTQMRVFLTFLRLLILPIHQNLDYDYPASTGILHPPLTLIGLCLIGCFILLIIKLRRSAPLIAFGLAWILITFSINLAPRSNVVFEHKLYLISFGFFLAAVVFLFNTVHNRKTLFWILLCLITILTIISFQRNKVWKNNFTLWNDAVQQSPHKARPYSNRGAALYNQGRFLEAMSDFNKAIEINPAYEKAYASRGVIYEKQGKFTEAMSDFNKAIEINPASAAAYTYRGIVYGQQGNLPQAILDFNKAIEIDPTDAEAYDNRGFAHYKQGRFKQAIFDLNKVIEIDPDYPGAHDNEALVYSHLKDYDKALAGGHKMDQ